MIYQHAIISFSPGSILQLKQYRLSANHREKRRSYMSHYQSILVILRICKTPLPTRAG